MWVELGAELPRGRRVCLSFRQRPRAASRWPAAQGVGLRCGVALDVSAAARSSRRTPVCYVYRASEKYTWLWNAFPVCPGARVGNLMRGSGHVWESEGCRSVTAVTKSGLSQGAYVPCDTSRNIPHPRAVPKTSGGPRVKGPAGVRSLSVPVGGGQAGRWRSWSRLVCVPNAPLLPRKLHPSSRLYFLPVFLLPRVPCPSSSPITSLPPADVVRETALGILCPPSSSWLREGHSRTPCSALSHVSLLDSPPSRGEGYMTRGAAPSS